MSLPLQARKDVRPRCIVSSASEEENIGTLSLAESDLIAGEIWSL